MAHPNVFLWALDTRSLWPEASNTKDLPKYVRLLSSHLASLSLYKHQLILTYSIPGPARPRPALPRGTIRRPQILLRQRRKALPRFRPPQTPRNLPLLQRPLPLRHRRARRPHKTRLPPPLRRRASPLQRHPPARRRRPLRRLQTPRGSRYWY